MVDLKILSEVAATQCAFSTLSKVYQRTLCFSCEPSHIISAPTLARRLPGVP